MNAKDIYAWKTHSETECAYYCVYNTHELVVWIRMRFPFKCVYDVCANIYVRAKGNQYIVKWQSSVAFLTRNLLIIFFLSFSFSPSFSKHLFHFILYVCNHISSNAMCVCVWFMLDGAYKRPIFRLLMASFRSWIKLYFLHFIFHRNNLPV